MKTILPLLFCFILLSSCNIFSSDDQFDGGKGTAENPYQISTSKQLQRIGDEENLDKHFIQVKDIDATGTESFNDGRGFNPIGSETNPFTGSYNGNNFYISGLNLDYNLKHIGLFGYVQNGLIENVALVNAIDDPNECIPDNSEFKKTAGSDDDLSETFKMSFNDIRAAGWLVGFNDGGTVRNSSSTGNFGMEGSSHIGGLVGYNTGRIYDSYTTGKISSIQGVIGGLTGGNMNGEIINSYTTGCTAAQGDAGGITAFNQDGKILNSFSSGEVQADIAGGLVAQNLGGQIQNSYSSAQILGTGWRSGGLVGINQGEIKDSYSLNEFIKSSEAESLGGIAGINGEDGTITTSYSAGKLASEPGTTIGGISGLNEGLIESSYWDVTATEINTGTGSGNADGATGLTTGQMNGPSARENMPEFDWENAWTTTPDGYPILRWQEED